ncbi:MAG: cytidine deaminase [Endomicrobiaceae bacterium]|nr:cytidine deaminase [Endomicrobiaceae bacterium]
MKNEKELYEKLLNIAKEASKTSYSPYSKFKVGCAVLCDNGEIYFGTNIENASYGLTICAERVAIFNAVSNGVKKIKAVAVYTDKKDITPCGACRQVIFEFSKDADIIYNSKNNKIKVTNIKSLLPNSFCCKSLK